MDRRGTMANRTDIDRLGGKTMNNQNQERETVFQK
jgi:hypothetical protein